MMALLVTRAPTMMALMLLVVGLSATHTSAAPRSKKGCCRSYSEGRIPFDLIQGYSLQTDKELCPINSIIFHTKKGKACTDPTLRWVMNHINRLRNAAQKVHDKTSKA